MVPNDDMLIAIVLKKCLKQKMPDPQLKRTLQNQGLQCCSFFLQKIRPIRIKVVVIFKTLVNAVILDSGIMYYNDAADCNVYS